MLEWSDVDLAVRDAVREFVDKEIRPHVDALTIDITHRCWSAHIRRKFP